MIKNIETLTAKEYLINLINLGYTMNQQLHPGEKINFSPNQITLIKILKGSLTPSKPC